MMMILSWNRKKIQKKISEISENAKKLKRKKKIHQKLIWEILKKIYEEGQIDLITFEEEIKESQKN